MKKPTKIQMILSLATVFIVVAALIAVSIMQATKLSRLHAEMRSFVDSIPAKRIEVLQARYPAGYTLYYTLNSYSGIYAVDPSDTLYEAFEMDRWAIETVIDSIGGSDSIGGIRILAPEIGWNPSYLELNKGGWFLSGEIGSSITLTNPRLDPNGLGRLWLEILDRNEKGVVFLIGQGRPDKPRSVL